MIDAKHFEDMVMKLSESPTIMNPILAYDQRFKTNYSCQLRIAIKNMDLKKIEEIQNLIINHSVEINLPK